MKIVHVCLCGTFGEDYAYQDNLLPKYHKLLGHDVSIIASVYCKIDTRTGKEEMAESGTKYLVNGIKLIRLKPFINHRINIKLHTVRGLYKSLVNERPDILFVHGLDSLSYFYCVKYKKTHCDTKLIFDNHADWHNSFHTRLGILWTKCIIKPIIVKPAIKYTSVYYGVTPARCSILTEMYGVPQKMVKLLPFGADDEELKIENKEILRKEIRKLYRINDDDFLIVTGGKIDKRKNIHLIAEAVSRIDNIHIKMLIFGAVNDELKDYFSKFRPDRIIMVGWVNSKDVYQYFYAADFVMFPGLHSVLWEQMLATETPCAITRIEGFEHVNYNNNCLLMEGNTVDYYKEIIEKVALDDSLYSTLKVNSCSPLSEKFRYKKIAQQVIDDVTK